jgi:two-component system response regulator FlrC
MNERILVVDDDHGMALAMERVLQRKDYAVDLAHDGSGALALLSENPYRVVITDLRMPGMGGRELLKRVRALRPGISIVVVTAYATVESAVSCVRDGALDYIQKPFSPESLERVVERALAHGAAAEPADDDPVAVDPSMLASLDLAVKAAHSEVTVLLEAESGAGKEVFARLIHRESPRANGPFVAVNCAALPRELLEAELFGHCKGAFTGASRDRKGHFQAADGGTLLLDEIGEMCPDLQARLLRVLQDHEVRSVGSDASVRVNVRVIAATNRNLRADVAAGRFREDLYYRLNVLPIRIPPLRERPSEVEPLARRFLLRYAGSEARLTRDAVARLRAHSWPGNVRELENVIQRAAIVAGGEVLDVDHLEIEAAPGRTPPEAPISLESAERDAIRRILEETGGNRTRAAEALGISPRTLRHKLKRYRDAGTPVVEPAR